jgi:hypothetical protein
LTIKIKGKGKRRIPFDLENSDGEVESFSIRGVAGWAFVEMMSKLASNDGDVASQVSAEGELAGELIGFFEDAIGDPETFQRFRKFVRNPDNGFGMAEIMELLEELTKEASKRPTEQPKPSRSGQTKTEVGSMELVSKEA